MKNSKQPKATKSNTNTTKNTMHTSISDHNIKRSFQPLVSKKDGSARLTFAGYQHSMSREQNPFLKIIFNCMDITHENPANIAILASYRLSEKNKLGKTLMSMGFTISDVEFEILDKNDEFGYRAIPENFTTQIYDFLDEQRGLVFKGKLEQLEENGLYRIDIESLTPLMKNGEQVRDYQSDEGETPDPDMQDTLD